jgi:hypothetical protein
VRGARTSKTLRGVLAALLLLGGAGCASAGPPAVPAPPNPDLTCSFSRPATRMDSLKALPPELRQALLATAGGMADRGEFFNAGDVVSKPAPFNRFIRAGAIGEYWFVWYEHGGFAYWKQIVIFGREYVLHIMVNQRAATRDLCAETERLIAMPGGGRK